MGNRERQDYEREISEHREDVANLTALVERLESANATLVATVRMLEKALNGSLKENEGLRAKLAKARGEAVDAPSAPSSQIPPYKKPSKAARKKGKKPGRPKGHVGVAREMPSEPTAVEVHGIDSCPHCAGPVTLLKSKGGGRRVRVRIVEDVEFSEPTNTEHQIEQAYCRSCKHRVEPVVTAAMPNDRIGLSVFAMTAVQHYLHGIPISKVVSMLEQQHGFKVSPGGLVLGWRKLSRFLFPFYVALGQLVRDAGVLHADETGWRVNGSTNWLWCFCTKRDVYYVIDASRSSAVPKDVLGEFFGGILVQDFYAAYNVCQAEGTQFCLAHLVREFKKIRAKYPEGLTEEFLVFEKKIKRLVRDAIRFARSGADPPEREKARLRFENRLQALTDLPDKESTCRYEHPDAERLAKRLHKHHGGIFTFVTNADVDSTNNWAELNIRPAVVMRKNSYGNQSRAGADTQAILMSVFRTLQLRQEDVIEEAIRLVQEQIVELHARRIDSATAEG